MGHPPPRALLVWELGDNLGHIANLIKIGEELMARGVCVYLALQNLAGVAAVVGHTGMTILQAPYAKVKPPREIRPVLTYADDLRPCGYDDPRELAMLIKAWEGLFGLVQPDVLIANSSPTALLAARSFSFPKIAIGLGYEVPVRMQPMPALRYWEKADDALIAAHEASVVAVINEALALVGRSSIGSIADMLAVDLELVSTFPHLDHYSGRSADSYVGPFFVADRGLDAAWPERRAGRKRVFAYLSHGRDFEATFKALRSLPHDVILVARRLPQDIVQKFHSEQFQIFTEAVQLGKLTYGCDVCITHGGAGTFIQFLLAGVPQLIIPNHIEQLMAAKRVENLGLGRVGQPRGSEKAARDMMHDVLERHDLCETAQAWARGHEGYSVDVQTCMIAERIMLLMDAK